MMRDARRSMEIIGVPTVRKSLIRLYHTYSRGSEGRGYIELVDYLNF